MSFTNRASLDDFTGRRLATLVLVGLLLFSGVGSMFVGSTGIAAAQQGDPSGNNSSAGVPEPPGNGSENGSSNDTSSKERLLNRFIDQKAEPMDRAMNITIQRVKQANVGYQEKVGRGEVSPDIETKVESLWKDKDVSKGKAFRDGNLSEKEVEKKISAIVEELRRAKNSDDGSPSFTEKDKKQVQRIMGAVAREAGNGTSGWPPQERMLKTLLRTDTNASGYGTNLTISAIKQKGIGYTSLSDKNQSKVRDRINDLWMGGSSQKDVKKVNETIAVFQGNLGSEFSETDAQTVESVLQGIPSVSDKRSGTPIAKPISNFIDGLLNGMQDMVRKMLEAIGKEGKKAVSWTLTQVYGLLDTPYPENSGWNKIFGTPTNAPFNTLFQNVMSSKLYPLMNVLLGIGIVFLGLSLSLKNPFLSRFRMWDLLIKFVTGMTLYFYGWTAITILQRSANEITTFILPTIPEVTGNVGNLLTLGAVPAAGAAAAGAFGFMTVFGVAIEFAVRDVLLTFVYPYVFGPLALIAYVAPSDRLRKYASMALWQYFNVLTMTIPVAILFKIAIALKWDFGVSKFASIFIMIALFLFMIIYPLVSTWFFLQMPRKAASAGRSAAAGAASRVGAAKDKLGWDRDDSSDSTATGDTSPGVRAENAVEASTESQSGMPSSGKLDPETVDRMDPVESSETTTAGEIRSLAEADERDPMNPDAKKEAFFEGEQQDSSGTSRTTMQAKLAD